MLRSLYETVAGLFGAKAAPAAEVKPASPGFGRDWTLVIPTGRTAVFRPTWHVAVDDPDLVRWCKAKRGLDSGTFSAILRDWLYLAEADSSPRLALLVVGGKPKFIVEAETGRVFGHSQRKGLEACENEAAGPNDLFSSARNALTFAINNGAVLASGVPTLEDAALDPWLTLIAPQGGKLRVYDVLPPADAPNKNVWWGEVVVGITLVGKVSPKCRALVPDGKWVHAGDVIGRFASADVRPAQPRHTVRPPSKLHLWPADLEGFASAAPRFVEKAIRYMLTLAGPEAMLLVDGAGSLDLDLFVWLMASGNSKLQEVRRQALGTCPLLTAVMGETGLAALSAVTDAIDGQRPFAPHLARMLHTTPTVLKAAASLKPRPMGRTRFPLLAQGALRAAAELQPNHLPGRGIAPRDREWRVFLDIYDVLRADRGKLLDMAVFTAGGPLWARSTKEQAQAVRARVQHVADCLHAAWRDLLIPNLVALARDRGGVLPCRLAERHLGPEAAGPILRGGRGFGALEELALRWNEERLTIGSAAVRLGSSLASWPPLSEPFRHEKSGLVVIPLTSTADLEAEGEAQEHCLGAMHSEDCLFGPVHILSVRREDGERVSTVELSMDEYGGVREFRLRQHLARRNTTPPEEAREAMADYMNGIMVNSIPVAWDDLMRDLSQRYTLGQDLCTRELPYDVDDETVADRVFDAWRFLLTGPQRKLTRSAWVEAIGLAKFLQPLEV